jgi:outer membrane PBP1 activator LpoA protein
MPRKLLVLALAATLAAGPLAVAAEGPAEANDLAALRNAVRADKRGYVESVLRLSDAEAKRFWPIYDRYQRARKAADERRTTAVVQAIGRDRPISDAYAKTLAGELMAADEAEIKARRILQNRLMRSVSPRTAARYLQLEARVRAIEAYDVATSLPLLK